MNASKTPTSDYRFLDRPEVLQFLFHPRPEDESSAARVSGTDVLIPVDGNCNIGGRFHMAAADGVNLLFFHGNGEIAADYDDLGSIYNQMGLNFLAVDYRGYGRSDGQPTVSAMMKDCHAIFEYARTWLAENGYTGALVLMGRSLGSASVLELAAIHADRIDGLIVESGFAHAGPLLRLLGIDLEALGFQEAQGFRNLDKIASFSKPLLVIHAEKDHIIPFSDGLALYETARSNYKKLLKIPGAGHNDIFMRGLSSYLTAVKALTTEVRHA
jgi:fermentation-respiration switch protein FrsA (DUF1100 family)